MDGADNIPLTISCTKCSSLLLVEKLGLASKRAQLGFLDPPTTIEPDEPRIGETSASFEPEVAVVHDNENPVAHSELDLRDLIHWVAMTLRLCV